MKRKPPETEAAIVEEAFFKRKAEVEKEFAELQAGVNRAQGKAGEAAVTHQSYVYQLDITVYAFP